jgi:acetate---CoA ligase (ADP-forming)
MTGSARQLSEATLDVTGRRVRPRQVDLGTFFDPKTVAVIGASDTPKRPNSAMYTKIRNWAEAHGATVYPVNPNRDDIGGIRCYRTISDVPVEVDLAVILVGEPLAVLPEVIDKGAKFGVIFAAGFAEVGEEGEQLQSELEELLAASDLRLLGPNTNLNAFETFTEGLPGKAIALITQSGHQGRPVFQSQQLGIRLSHWAPTGNEADLEFADFAVHFADLDEVGVVAGYIEGFKDGRTLMLAADHAAQRGVPLVLVKVGRTDEGRTMAKAHTGHLTGSDAVTSAVFRQFGVTRVDGLDELQDTAAMFARTAPPTGDGVCIYAISGGTGAHMADMAAAAGLKLPRLTDQTQDELREVIPSYLRVSNPVDSGGPPSGDPVKGRRILEAIVADPNVAVVICPITGALESMSNQLATDLVEVAKTTDKPICVVWGSPIGDEPAYRETLLAGGIPVFRTFRNCVNAVSSYLGYHEFAQRYRSPFTEPVLDPLPAAQQARSLITPGRALSEHGSKQVLSAYGIPVTRDVLAGSGQEAIAAAGELGARVVLKVSSPDLLHKSDLGLVKVGVTGPDEVAAAYEELLQRARNAAPDADIEGVLISEMISDGVETVIGVAQDDLFGPTVMFGLGGVFVEVLADVTFRVPPFDLDETHRMIREVRGFPLLEGVRGSAPADIDALADAIMKVQRLALDLSGDITELDINPFVVRPDGAVALDALVVPR